MAGSYNKVILMGNLGHDPTLRTTPSGSVIVEFSLCVNENYTDKDGVRQELQTWIDVKMFGKRGEAFARFHHKGSSAFVEGRVREDRWEDKQTGQKRRKVYVVADSWEFVESGDDPKMKRQPAPRQREIDETPF